MCVFLRCMLAVSQFPWSVPVVSRVAGPPYMCGCAFMNHTCMRSAPRNSPRSERQPIPVLPNAADQAFVYSLSFLLLPDPAFFIYSDCLHAFLPFHFLPLPVPLRCQVGQVSSHTFADACMQVGPQVSSHTFSNACMQVGPQT